MNVNISELITIAISLISGILGVPLVTGLKNWLKLNDTKALLLTAVIAAILAEIQLTITGQLPLETTTLDNFYAVFTAIYTASNVVFKALTYYQRSGGLG